MACAGKKQVHGMFYANENEDSQQKRKLEYKL